MNHDTTQKEINTDKDQNSHSQMDSRSMTVTDRQIQRASGS